MTFVQATYLVHDEKGQFDKKAEGIALGLTIGSWTDLPSLEQQQLKKHKGEVVRVEPLADDEAIFNKTVKRALITIQYPAVNFATDFNSLLTTVFGKLSLDGTIKLVDLTFAPEWEAAFKGPRFGIRGIREKIDVWNRPLLMAIFKGVIGKETRYIADQLEVLARSGIDLVKDDEILFDNELAPFEQRIIEGKKVTDRVYEQTGHRTLYAVNLTGPVFSLRDKARKAKELGADALLFNVFTYGLDALRELAEDDEIALPFMAHPSFSGAISSSAVYGVSTGVLLGKLLRLAGADFSLFPSPYGSVALAREEALAIKAGLLNDSSLQQAFPVPSAGIHPGLTAQLVHDFGIDSIINAGGGVFGHPSGTRAGVEAFRTAIQAATNDVSLTAAAEKNDALKEALTLWGVKEVQR